MPQHRFKCLFYDDKLADTFTFGHSLMIDPVDRTSSMIHSPYSFFTDLPYRSHVSNYQRCLARADSLIYRDATVVKGNASSELGPLDNHLLPAPMDFNTVCNMSPCFGHSIVTSVTDTQQTW